MNQDSELWGQYQSWKEMNEGLKKIYDEIMSERKMDQAAAAKKRTTTTRRPKNAAPSKTTTKKPAPAKKRKVDHQ